jgi:chromosome condensin MukBEF ATPase and DNA-binding subunit MukB
MAQVSGWIETENGAEVFDFEGRDMRAIAKAMIEVFGEDAGETDMEATNEDGDDVTERLCSSIYKLQDIRKSYNNNEGLV